MHPEQHDETDTVYEQVDDIQNELKYTPKRKSKQVDGKHKNGDIITYDKM